MACENHSSYSCKNKKQRVDGTGRRWDTATNKKKGRPPTQSPPTYSNGMLVKQQTLNPDSRVSSQRPFSYFFAILCVSDGTLPNLCQWSEPLQNVQYCRSPERSV